MSIFEYDEEAVFEIVRKMNEKRTSGRSQRRSHCRKAEDILELLKILAHAQRKWRENNR